MMNLGVSPEQLVLAAEQTLYMVFAALVIGTVLALFLAVTLVVSRQQGLIPNRRIYVLVNSVVNTVRSVPFIILLVFILPLTKLIVGTRIGTTAEFKAYLQKNNNGLWFVPEVK